MFLVDSLKRHRMTSVPKITRYGGQAWLCVPVIPALGGGVEAGTELDETTYQNTKQKRGSRGGPVSKELAFQARGPDFDS